MDTTCGRPRGGLQYKWTTPAPSCGTKEKLCWGAELLLTTAHCTPGYVPSKAHFQNHFCPACRQGPLNVPAARVRVLTDDMSAALASAARSTHGFWKLVPSTVGSGYMRIINNTTKCRGAKLVCFKEQPPPSLPWGESFVPRERLSDDQIHVPLQVAYGTLCPLTSDTSSASLLTVTHLVPVRGTQCTIIAGVPVATATTVTSGVPAGTRGVLQTSQIGFSPAVPTAPPLTVVLQVWPCYVPTANAYAYPAEPGATVSSAPPTSAAWSGSPSGGALCFSGGGPSAHNQAGDTTQAAAPAPDMVATADEVQERLVQAHLEFFFSMIDETSPTSPVGEERPSLDGDAPSFSAPPSPPQPNTQILDQPLHVALTGGSPIELVHSVGGLCEWSGLTSRHIAVCGSLVAMASTTLRFLQLLAEVIESGHLPERVSPMTLVLRSLPRLSEPAFSGSALDMLVMAQRQLIHGFAVLMYRLAQVCLDRPSLGDGATHRSKKVSSALTMSRRVLICLLWISYTVRLCKTIRMPVETLRKELSHLHGLFANAARVSHHWICGWLMSMPSRPLDRGTDQPCDQHTGATFSCLALSMSLHAAITLVTLVRSDDVAATVWIALRGLGGMALGGGLLCPRI